MKLISEKGSPLLSVGILVALLLAAIFIVFFLKPFEKREKGVIVSPGMPITVTAIPTKETSSNIPPLWPGVEWGKPEREQITFIDTSGKLINSTGYRIESDAEIFDPSEFLNHYFTLLDREGWLVTDIAGGPNGEVYGYQNGTKYLTVGYEPAPNSTIKAYLEYN